MDEVRATYYETNAERANLKNSAFHKKNGPSANGMKKQYMTNEEIRERHGECKIYDLSKFMTFSEFREMPSDLQVQYLNLLQDKYDVGLLQINKEVFGNRDDLLRSHLKIKGILKDCHPEKKRAKTRLKQLQDDVETQKRHERFADAIDLSQSTGIGEENELPKFMTWEDFKQLSNEDMAKFIGRLFDEYKYIGIRTISMELFGCNGNTPLKDLLKRRNIKIINARTSKMPTRGAAYDECLERFVKDILLWKSATESAEIAIPDTEIKVESEPEVVETIDISALPMFMNLDEVKKLTAAEFAAFVNRILDEYHVSVQSIPVELGWKCSSNYISSRLFYAKGDYKLHTKYGGLYKTPEEREANLERFKKDIALWKAKLAEDIIEPVNLETERTIEEVKSESIAETAVQAETSIQTADDDITKTISTVPFLFYDAATGKIFSSDGDTVNKIKEFDRTILEGNKTAEETEKDALFYHDTSFTSNYVGEGLDEEELDALKLLFKGKKVRVELRITML